MILSQSEVLHLAQLARLQLSQAELDNFTTQLEQILHYLNKLAELEIKPNDSSMTASLVAGRNDEVKPFPTPADLIKQAPQTADSWLVVPPVFGEDE